MKFLSFKKEIYPLLALILSIFVFIYGLVMSTDVLVCSVFLGITAFIYLIFGFYKQVLIILPGLIIVGGLFFLGYYLANYTITSSWAMVNRIGSLFVAIIPGLSVSATRMSRNLSTLRCPRSITLGMLITMSFIPLLKDETHKIKRAMKTKGATNIFNPRIFYRAFFYPFIMRIINISDGLSLSIETRGFSLSSKNYSIYKKEYPTIKDLILLLLIVASAILTTIFL